MIYLAYKHSFYSQITKHFMHNIPQYSSCRTHVSDLYTDKSIQGKSAEDSIVKVPEGRIIRDRAKLDQIGTNQQCTPQKFLIN